MPPKVDVRRLLKKQKEQKTKSTKITHPFAKYDETGRLNCIVCQTVVKSEVVWQGHLGSMGHRDNIQKLKALKQQQQQLKRPAPPLEEQNKRLKTTDYESSESSESEQELPNDFFDDQQEPEVDTQEQVPADFFDNKPQEEEALVTENGLPVGFFDNPEEEAKANGGLAPEEQARLKLEKELEEFNEAMIDVTTESRQVQEEDDETFWQERNFELSREQAELDARVEKLKQLRQTGAHKMDIDQPETNELKSSVRQLLLKKPTKQTESMFDEDDSEEEEEEEEEDWRAQQL